MSQQSCAVNLITTGVLRKDGFAATTDANLVLGRILPEFFPKIFGKTEDQPLDQGAAEAALDELAAQVNGRATEGGQPHMSRDEVCSALAYNTIPCSFSRSIPF